MSQNVEWKLMYIAYIYIYIYIHIYTHIHILLNKVQIVPKVT